MRPLLLLAALCAVLAVSQGHALATAEDSDQLESLLVRILEKASAKKEMSRRLRPGGQRPPPPPTTITSTTTTTTTTTAPPSEAPPPATGTSGLTSADIEAFGNYADVVTVDDTSNQNYFIITSTGLPADDIIAQFPNRANPNSVSEQNYRYRIPRSPKVADSPSCLPMGPIGLGVDGIPFFNPYSALGLDAVETETMGVCNGHPDMLGRYHHHAAPACIADDSPNQFLGVAFDGFEIYGPVEADGSRVDAGDLDECNGKTDADGVYRYRLTDTFPYILGCFKGTPSPDVNLNLCKYGLYVSKRIEMNLIRAVLDMEELRRAEETRGLKKEATEAAKRGLAKRLKQALNAAYMDGRGGQ